MSDSNTTQDCGDVIVLVEDDKIDAMAVRRSLSKEFPGAELVHAKDGFEGLEALHDLQAQGQERVVVVLDLNMPRMTGIELLENIRADPMLSGTLAFVLTTSEDPNDRRDAYRYNIAGFLSKAWDTDGSRKLAALMREVFTAVKFPPIARASDRKAS